uniref:Uncharacterized protein n=1 Tax=Arundo donax TaxID=35708 RepID=A0A0A8YJE3_ARUDO
MIWVTAHGGVGGV